MQLSAYECAGVTVVVTDASNQQKQVLLFAETQNVQLTDIPTTPIRLTLQTNQGAGLSAAWLALQWTGAVQHSLAADAVGCEQMSQPSSVP